MGLYHQPFLYFFRAEDGIRDHCVTGVQTYALPISSSLYSVVRSTSDVLSASRITGTMIPSLASTAMPTSMELDCTTRFPINFAAALGFSARARASARSA